MSMLWTTDAREVGILSFIDNWCICHHDLKSHVSAKMCANSVLPLHPGVGGQVLSLEYRPPRRRCLKGLLMMNEAARHKRFKLEQYNYQQKCG